MKYIVTGASGLIGSALVWELNNRGERDILLVDHLGTSEKWKNLRALQYADYLEKDEFLQVLPTLANENLHGIFHLGACSSTVEKDATYLIHNNFHYTQTLAQYALGHQIPFLYASSAATYGDGALGYVDDESAIEALRPLNMYGYSKQMFDLWAKKQGILDSLTGVKFTNVYGPNEHHKAGMRSVVLRAYEQIQESGCVKLFRSYHPDYADGEFKRDFLYVKDAVDMVLHLMTHQCRGLYNVGSGRAETWNSLASAVFSALDRPVKIEYIDMPESLRAKYQYYTKAEIGKLRVTGYHKEPRSLKDSVADYVRNYLVPDHYLGDESHCSDIASN